MPSLGFRVLGLGGTDDGLGAVCVGFSDSCPAASGGCCDR